MWSIVNDVPEPVIYECARRIDALCLPKNTPSKQWVAAVEQVMDAVVTDATTAPLCLLCAVRLPEPIADLPDYLGDDIDGLFL